MKYTGTGGIENAPNLQSFLNGATYEIYKEDGKTFVYSGVMPTLTGNATSYIESPEVGSNYRLRINPPVAILCRSIPCMVTRAIVLIPK